MYKIYDIYDHRFNYIYVRTLFYDRPCEQAGINPSHCIVLVLALRAEKLRGILQ